MTALQGAVESTAPVSRLHEHQSYEVADFPVPTGREELVPVLSPDDQHLPPGRAGGHRPTGTTAVRRAAVAGDPWLAIRDASFPLGPTKKKMVSPDSSQMACG